MALHSEDTNQKVTLKLLICGHVNFWPTVDKRGHVEAVQFLGLSNFQSVFPFD